MSTGELGYRSRARRKGAAFVVGDRWGRRRPTVVARLWFGLLAAAADAVTVFATTLVVGVVFHNLFYRVGGMGQPYAELGAFLAILFVFFNALRDEYGIVTYLAITGHPRRVLFVWNMTFLTALVLVFVVKETGDISRIAVGLIYLTGLVTLLAGRAAIVHRVKSGAVEGRISILRVMLIGSEPDLTAFEAQYQPARFGIDVIASAVLRGTDTQEDDLALAAASARVLRPDDVFILVPWSMTDVIDACLAAFMNVPAAIHLGPHKVLERFNKANVSRFGDISTLSLVRQPLTAVEVLAKRAFDIAGAIALLVALVPAALLVALAIKLDSRGPVLFRQRRYGFNQQTFDVLKFRSMHVAENGRTIRQAVRNDPRVTRVGRFMRRFNIDELPQLLNVLRGQMSLVGPRPHALAHNQQYEATIADYARRHNVKPGITGWAQIHGLRGETADDGVMRLRVEHDLYYIDNWTLGLDLRILIRTLFSARAFTNAY